MICYSDFFLPVILWKPPLFQKGFGALALWQCYKQSGTPTHSLSHKMFLAIAPQPYNTNTSRSGIVPLLSTWGQDPVFQKQLSLTLHKNLKRTLIFYGSFSWHFDIWSKAQHSQLSTPWKTFSIYLNTTSNRWKTKRNYSYNNKWKIMSLY